MRRCLAVVGAGVRLVYCGLCCPKVAEGTSCRCCYSPGDCGGAVAAVGVGDCGGRWSRGPAVDRAVPVSAQRWAGSWKGRGVSKLTGCDMASDVLTGR